VCVSTGMMFGVCPRWSGSLSAVIFAEKVSFLLRSVKVVLWQCIYGSMYDHEMNGSHKSRGGWHLWKTASLRLRLERFGPAVPWLVTVRGGLLAPEWPRDPCPTISWRLNAFWSTSSARRRSLSIYLISCVALRLGSQPFYYLVLLIIFVTRAAQLCVEPGSLRPTDCAGPL
jgi:hypothetical protein